jgi:ABC-type multidrug transport system fused ATPase/permease subunit
LGLSLPQASGLLLALFTIGAGANAGRAILMKISGKSAEFVLLCRYSRIGLISGADLCGIGQRIVTRLRESMYSAALRQEVEFVERGEGDVLSRLSSDTYLVGER